MKDAKYTSSRKSFGTLEVIVYPARAGFFVPSQENSRHLIGLFSDDDEQKIFN
jgi:hypothetical protein